jgi:hypothetical protein
MIAALSLGLAVNAGAQTPVSFVPTGNALHHGSISLQHSGPFYDNSNPTGFVLPTTDEVADDVAFTGAYRVDGFDFAYELTGTDTTDATVRFYEPNSVDGGAVGQTPVAAFTLQGLPPGDFLIPVDLEGTGFDFLLSSAQTFGAEGALMSIQFSNAKAGWLTADGGGSLDAAQDVTTGDIVSAEPVVNASFFATLYGQAVPEPGALALFAGVLVSGGVLTLRRRRR